MDSPKKKKRSRKSSDVLPEVTIKRASNPKSSGSSPKKGGAPIVDLIDLEGDIVKGIFLFPLCSISKLFLMSSIAHI